MKKKLLFFFAANILCFYNLFSAWYSNWAFREMITFNNAVDNDLTNFPVLLNISNHHFLKYCAGSSGADLAFTLVDGSTKLDHEIEYFDKTNGQVWAWIRMPILDSAEADSNKIYIYYDITQTGDQQNAAKVWNSNYKAVWHMSTVFDSTLNTNHGVMKGTITQTGGKICNAWNFNGSTANYLDCGSNESLNITNILTIEAVMKFDAAAASYFMSKGSYQKDGWYIRVLADGSWSICVNTNGAASFPDSTINLPTAEWLYLTAVISNESKTILFYTNGSYAARTTPTITFSNNIGRAMFVGRSTDGNAHTGPIDEVRISDTSRSSNWIATSYSNFFFPAAFRSLGSLECGTRGIKIGGTISGAVSNNVTVVISNTVYYTTNSAADGTWEAVVPAGNYIITCITNGYIITPSQYVVSPDETNLNYNFTSIQQKTLSGAVLDTCGIGIKNADITLAGNMTQNTVSDTQGIYSFNVSNGVYTVSFSASGYISSSIANLTISADTLTNNIILYNSYSITGTVYTAPRGTIIKCLGASQTQTTETDENGIYSFTVPGGFYSVYPQVSNLASQPDKYSMQITANKTGCNFNLFQMKYAVSGYVADVYGKPQEKITVHPNNNITLAVNTDEKGFYCFYLTNGTHTVALAENGNFFTDSLKKNINVAGTGLSNINFILDYSLQDNTGSFIFSRSRLINSTDGKYNISFYKPLEGLHLCKITLMDPRGKSMEKLYDGILDKGFYSYDIKNSSRLKTGIYILQVRIQMENTWKQYGRILTVIK